MKLYSLKLRAIGPFAGEFEIDLAAVGRSGLFLLEGPTGAGKSTLIDALVFALYGHVAGSGASKQRLYSHHADVGVEPYVDLVFEVDAGLFRVRRTPAYERPKKRGTGQRTINESVLLTRLADVDRPDHGETISTRAAEVGDEITRLIGLRRDQFLQTVVLAQGEFATFLRSAGEDRKKLLETIFRTDIYEQVTRELVEARKVAGRRTADAERAVEQACHLLQSVAQVEYIDSLTEITEQATAEAAACQQSADETRQALLVAQAELADAEALAARLRQRSDLLQRRARLEQQAAAIGVAQTRLDIAARAALVGPAVQARDAADAELGYAADRRDRARAQIVEDIEADLADGRVDELTSELERLAQLQQLHDELPNRARQRDELADQLAAAQLQVQELTARYQARPVERARLVRQRAAAHEQHASRPALEHDLTAARSRHDAAIKAEALTTQVSQARGLVKKLAGDAATATHMAKELQLGRIRGIAGELAEALVVGQACVVCGSDAHPNPATRSVDHPDEDEVALAERRQHDLTAALSEAEAAADVAGHELAHWTEQSGGLSVSQAETERDAAQAALDVTDGANDLLDELDDRLATLEAQAAHDDEHRADLDRSIATLTERTGQLDRSITDDTDRIGRAIAGRGGTLPAAIAQVNSQRAALREFIAADRAHGTAQESAATRISELQAALAEHGFSDRDEVETAAITEYERAGLQHDVDSYQTERVVVDEALAAPEIAALTGGEAPAPETMRSYRDVCATENETAVGRAATAANRARQVAAAADEVTSAQQRLDAAGEQARAVTAMAGVADGTSARNLKSLTLGTYVLLRRFEEVVAAANRRLNMMSQGRYQLRVSDERERSASGRRTGLSLAVIDSETSREREPRTLSGGETFYVSLCLALGLADAVSAESGGVQLDTLFVDEGFGSLDPQTLDTVMAELGRLAEGGRCVGLVSHVEELKQRVSERISVRRRTDGSSSVRVTA